MDGAIHRAAGPELLDYCRGLNGCPAGEVRLSPGFDLPAKYVIHMVGPIWRGGHAGEVELLASCYEQSLRLARQQGAGSIAFPNINTGVFGYLKSPAAKIALIAMLASEQDFDRIVARCFSADDKALYEQVLVRLHG